MVYPYAGRNLFEAPESYSYASATSADYVEMWRESRSQFREALWRADAPSVSIPRPQPPAVCLEETLIAAVGRPDEQSVIEPFVKKYEVFKRLFAFYGVDGRRLPDSPPAPLSTYVVFAEALLRQAQAGSVKHLSTLLKLTDALTSIDSGSYTASEGRRLRDVLSSESGLVLELEAKP